MSTVPPNLDKIRLSPDYSNAEFKNPKANQDEIIGIWINIAYQLFENMMKSSEYTFFISTPQMISQLSFLMAVTPETTTGLRVEFGFNPISKELAHQIEHKNLLDSTESFLRKWRVDLKKYATPGKISSARRALVYPTNAVSFHMNVLDCLSRYGVEWKVFEGAKEHRHWISHKLEGNFDKQVVVNVWDEESIDSETDKPAAIRTKTPEEEEKEKKTATEKKLPILMWISNATVAILPEVFDVYQLYPHKDIDYFRIVGTPNKRIKVMRMENLPWNMVILPTADSHLNLLLIYDFTDSLSDFPDLQSEIEKILKEKDEVRNGWQCPCVVKMSGSIEKYEGVAKKYIYFPSWSEKDLHPNRFVEGLQETVEVEDLFSNGGFGELTYPNMVPSPGTQDPYTIGHVQHFSNITFFNSPSTRAKPGERRPLLNPLSPDTEVVPYPFCALLWDSKQQFPVFMGKVTGKSKNASAEPEKRGFFKKIFGWN